MTRLQALVRGVRARRRVPIMAGVHIGTRQNQVARSAHCLLPAARQRTRCVMVQAALAIQAEFLRHYIARVFGRGAVPMQRNLSVPKADQSFSNNQRMRAPYTRVLQQPPRDSVACALHNDGRRWMKPARRAVCDPRDPFRRAPRRCHPLGPCVAHALPVLALRPRARTYSTRPQASVRFRLCALRRHLGKVYLPPPAQESFAHDCGGEAQPR